jgi:hypothetical protein
MAPAVTYGGVRDLVPSDVSVASVVGRKLVAVRGRAGVTEAVELMPHHGVRRLR